MTDPTSGRASVRVTSDALTVPAPASTQPESANDSSRSSTGGMKRSRYVTTARVRQLAAQLPERERLVLGSLHQLRILTSLQLERLHFTDVTRRQARAVLAAMVERRLIARLPRQVGGVRAGSAGYVYVLDVAGQRLSSVRRPAGAAALAGRHSVPGALAGRRRAVRPAHGS